MAERTLRGSRLGTQSLETEAGIQLAPRVEAVYDLPDGRVIVVPFAADADILTTGRRSMALRESCGTPWVSRKKKARPLVSSTHWDMLLERRSRRNCRTCSTNASKCCAPAPQCLTDAS